MRGESGRNELLRGPFALFGVRISAKLVRNLAKHRRSLSFRRKPSGRRRYCRHLPAEKERMISGRTFAREMIALRQRETKRAGRILALQGQNPGQLELRTHSEFGANLSVTPGGFAFLCLRAIPRRSSPAGYHSLRLRPAKTKPQYLLLQPAMPTPRDERLIYTPHHPVRWPYRRRPHLLN